MMPTRECRWICHTCRTVCDGGGAISDLKPSETGVLPTPIEARRFVRYAEQWLDPFAFHGAIKSMRDHLSRFARWRERHNRHRVQVLTQQMSWPEGTESYTKETIQ